MAELDRVYIVRLDGMGCGTNSHDILICKPSDLEVNLNEMAWAHHEQWFEGYGNLEDGIEYEEECQAGATETEYTPETMDRLDSKRSGGGSFLSESGVRETWEALGYGRPKFDGATYFEVCEYIRLWDIPVCQAGVGWQEIENWQRQDLACQDVIRVLDNLQHKNVPHLPPLLDTQLKGAYTMAENEISLFNANLQKVIARLKAL